MSHAFDLPHLLVSVLIGYTVFPALRLMVLIETFQLRSLFYWSTEKEWVGGGGVVD